jgi:probable HAF family extracellular repeat protein
MKNAKISLVTALTFLFCLSSAANAYRPIIDLGTLDGTYSYALAINNNGQIVGNAEINADGDYHACLFDPTGNGNNIDLNTLINPASGWILKEALCINNNGWIVGEGINPDGYIRAYLLTPEPASAILIGVGCLFARLRQRRR